VQAEHTQRIALQKQSELNDMKSRFISMASHEFRTPLATIHGSVELLQHYDDRMPAERKRQTLEKIDVAVERMMHMLENVLVIGRHDAGQLEFRPRPLAITPFCIGLIEELGSTMATALNPARVVLDLPPPTKHYLLDETLIRNIAGNLLSNAFKYSDPASPVHFSVTEQRGELVLTVSDQGIGIPMTDQAHLFESFHRASNVGQVAGTGLGLTIVKDAVDCHNGRVQVQSQEGKGSSFTVFLPVSVSPAESLNP
jgi:signal transduction histidine kinase